MPTHKSPEPEGPSRVQPDFGGREALFVGDRSGAYSTWLNRVEADRGIQQSWRRSKVRAWSLNAQRVVLQVSQGVGRQCRLFIR